MTSWKRKKKRVYDQNGIKGIQKRKYYLFGYFIGALDKQNSFQHPAQRKNNQMN